MNQTNIIVDILGGYDRDLVEKLGSLIGIEAARTALLEIYETCNSLEQPDIDIG